MTEYNVDEYTVEIEGEDGEHTFKIFLVDNKITLQLIEVPLENNKPGRNYEGEFTLDDLRQINKIFLLTNTIYDAQDEFKKAVEKQKIELSKNEVFVNITFYMILGTDNAPFVVALPRNESARVMKLEHDINILKLERDNLYDKLTALKNLTNETIKNTSELDEENKELYYLTNQVEEEMKIPPIIPKKITQSVVATSTQSSSQMSVAPVPVPTTSPVPAPVPEDDIKTPVIRKFPSGIENDIIKNEIEIDFVKKRIQSYFDKNKNIRYNLIYKGSRHGDRASVFHGKCDTIARTLTLILDSFGNRFGGYTSRDWSGKCVQKKDDKAFIFSIDKGKIYNVLPNQAATGCYPNCGPVFFGCQIRIYDHFFSKGGTTYLKGLNYNTTQDFELTNGKQAYGVKELEVYEVRVL